MGAADYILLALIGGYMLWIIFRPRKKGCCGCCAHCAGCKKK